MWLRFASQRTEGVMDWREGRGYIEGCLSTQSFCFSHLNYTFSSSVFSQSLHFTLVNLNTLSICFTSLHYFQSTSSLPLHPLQTTDHPHKITMSSYTSSQSSSMAVFGRGGYNAPVDSGRGGYNAPVDAGRGGYNAPLKRGPDDDDEAEDGRGGYN